MKHHPNFKKGYENMMKIASTKHGKKVYGEAVGKSKAKALDKAKSGISISGDIYGGKVAHHRSWNESSNSDVRAQEKSQWRHIKKNMKSK